MGMSGATLSLYQTVLYKADTHTQRIGVLICDLFFAEMYQQHNKEA